MAKRGHDVLILAATGLASVVLTWAVATAYQRRQLPLQGGSAATEARQVTREPAAKLPPARPAAASLAPPAGQPADRPARTRQRPSEAADLSAFEVRIPAGADGAPAAAGPELDRAVARACAVMLRHPTSLPPPGRLPAPR